MIPIKYNNLLKKLCLIDVVLLLIVYTSVLVTPPAQGYEISIYYMYSPVFWVIVTLVVIISIIVISLSDYWKVARYWVVAFSSVIILYMIMLLLPLSRGYYRVASGMSDIFAHLSWAQNILNNGHIDTYYPITHILMVEFNVASINLDYAAYYLPVLFSFLLILFLSVVGISLQKDRCLSLIPVLFALPLLYTDRHLYAQPYMFGIFFVPLFYYLFIKSIIDFKRKSYTALLIIVSFFIAYLHPLLLLFLILSLLGFLIVNIWAQNSEFKKANWKNYIIQLIAVLGIVFCLWYLSFPHILKGFSTVISALLDETASTPIFEQNVDFITNTNIDLLQVIRLFIVNYGPAFLYLFVGFIAIIFVIQNLWKKQASEFELIFSVQFLLGIIIAFAFIMGNFILSSLIRSIGFALIASTILIPLVISAMMSRISSKYKKKQLYSILVSFLVVVVILSIAIVYQQLPFNTSSSLHMTHMEKEGLDWFLESRDGNHPVLSMKNSLNYKKYELYYNSRIYGDQIDNSENRIHYLNLLPSHFGYNTNATIAKLFSFGTYYYLSKERDRQNYLAIPEGQQDWLTKVTVADFVYLKQDNAVNLLYSNGEFESWIILIK